MANAHNFDGFSNPTKGSDNENNPFSFLQPIKIVSRSKDEEMEDEDEAARINMDYELLSPDLASKCSPICMSKNNNSYNENFTNSFRLQGRETFSQAPSASIIVN
jgi:hypothetical protein